MTELKYLKRTKANEDGVGVQVVQIKTDDIRPNRAQPRADFEQNAIIRLADSIRRYGILQPLSVRPSDPEDIYRYELIAGERRLRAAKMLGYLTVPCIIMDVTEQTSAELAIIENLLREDLNMFEQAYGFRKLIENHHLTQEEVARRMSLSQSAVANKLRLLRLSYEEQRLILETGLTERHARATLRVENAKKRLDAIRYISEKKLNVQESENYIEALLERKCDVLPQNRTKTSANVLLEEFREEKELSEMVRLIRHRVDRWNKSGKAASVEVENQKKEIGIIIRLSR
ncbi:MAG: ParB/RepB/Spo0J family partition protein [Clostridia bacterium]|nr:ParB/RepB/Spo0J family partition protein [Clostridia bacterium]